MRRQYVREHPVRILITAVAKSDSNTKLQLPIPRQKLRVLFDDSKVNNVSLFGLPNEKKEYEVAA